MHPCVIIDSLGAPCIKFNIKIKLCVVRMYREIYYILIATYTYVDDGTVRSYNTEGCYKETKLLLRHTSKIKPKCGAITRTSRLKM